jgi:hypothetical protein
VRRQQENEALLHVVDDPAALREPEHQGRERVVAEDEIGRLAGDGGPGAHRDRHVGPVQGGCVVHPVAGDRDDPAIRPRRAHEALLLLRRGARDDVEVPELLRQSCVVPPRELLAGHDPVGLEAGLPGDRRGGPRVVAGHDHHLDPRPTCGRHRLGDPRSDRIGEADEGTHRPLAVVDGPRERDETFAGRGRRVDEVAPPAALGLVDLGV